MRRFHCLLILAASLCLSPALCAQNYSIDWFTINGGGGDSSGGIYEVNGTIGQTDTANMTGGNYTLEGGFWSAITLVQTIDSPLLYVAFSGKNALITWTNTGTNFILQQSVTMLPGSWSNASLALSTNNGIISTTVHTTNTHNFYRLH